MEMFGKSKPIRKIYLVGPLNTPSCRDDTDNESEAYLYNIRDMIKVAVRLIKNGLSPYPIGMDFSYFFNDSKITIEELKNVSLSWLEVSDAVLTLPNWDKSEGSIKEVAKARELQIPIFHNYDFLISYITARNTMIELENEENQT